jgi:hypothetical protein
LLDDLGDHRAWVGDDFFEVNNTGTVDRHVWRSDVLQSTVAGLERGCGVACKALAHRVIFQRRLRGDSQVRLHVGHALRDRRGHCGLA